LSSVESFFVLEEPGRGAKDVFGLRGPGFRTGGFVDAEVDVDFNDIAEFGVCVGDEDGLDESVTGIDGAGMETSGGASLDDSVRGSFHKGHFFASGEFSRTSTTSLHVEKTH
jgi:hypothetical protein